MYFVEILSVGALVFLGLLPLEEIRDSKEVFNSGKLAKAISV
jgi:hypothetical protein